MFRQKGINNEPNLLNTNSIAQQELPPIPIATNITPYTMAATTARHMIQKTTNRIEPQPQQQKINKQILIPSNNIAHSQPQLITHQSTVPGVPLVYT